MGLSRKIPRQLTCGARIDVSRARIDVACNRKRPFKEWQQNAAESMLVASQGVHTCPLSEVRRECWIYARHESLQARVASFPHCPRNPPIFCCIKPAACLCHHSIETRET